MTISLGDWRSVDSKNIHRPTIANSSSAAAATSTRLTAGDPKNRICCVVCDFAVVGGGESTLQAPTGINLLPTSDTGVSADDDLTNLNNASGADTLQFEVTGVLAGATVRVFSDGVLIGTATAATAMNNCTVLPPTLPVRRNHESGGPLRCPGPAPGR